MASELSHSVHSSEILCDKRELSAEKLQRAADGLSSTESMLLLSSAQNFTRIIIPVSDDGIGVAFGNQPVNKKALARSITINNQEIKTNGRICANTTATVCFTQILPISKSQIKLLLSAINFNQISFIQPKTASLTCSCGTNNFQWAVQILPQQKVTSKLNVVTFTRIVQLIVVQSHCVRITS